jgi:hypothetical protein
MTHNATLLKIISLYLLMQNTNLIRDEEQDRLTIKKVTRLKSRNQGHNLKLYIPPRANSSSTSAPDSVFQ